MKSKIFGLDNLDNIIFIALLLVITLIICFKSITIHQNIIEQFEDGANNNELDKNELDKNELDKNELDKNELDDQLKKIGNEYNEEEDNDVDQEALAKQCQNLEVGGFGSITSKYSGKTINIDPLPPIKGSARKYIIQWQPIGGKPGGCITANADGTYSTPICNANINKQQWFVKEIKGEEQYLKIIPKDRRRMGRSMDETEFPFHIVQSSEYQNYCLHYEGGGLAIREIANYDSQKWDVSKEKIVQDPLPTQSSSKFSGLSPGHKLTNADKSLGTVGGNGGKEQEKDPMQFNINVDPDLLGKLGIETGLGSNGSNGSGNGSNGNGSNGSNSGNGKEGGLLIYDDEATKKRKQDTGEMMINYNGNEELCKDCGKIPDNMIKKDLVKSMCIGCNNIDNVLE